uniref:TSA: Wollemia nobilis Ref_Wollemi_Transcript_30205_968 transcribed RNA sequence n=1 Tax=Wollemia nobilis TaxID=56998 RepID=A0A0C9QKW9_9CONI
MAAKNSLRNLIPSIKKCLSPSPRGEYVGFRGLSTSAVKDYSPNEDSAMDIDRSSRQAPLSNRDQLFSDVWDPLFSSRRLGKLMNMADLFFDNPFVVDVGVRGARKPWDVVEDKDALRLRVDMPGLGKEDVSVHVEEGALVIKGEAQGDAELDGSGRRYSSRIDIPPKLYKLDEIKAEMKNGMLKITVPRVREEEIKNVINVAVE